MRVIYTLLIFHFAINNTYAQELLHIKQGCSYEDQQKEVDIYSNEPSEEATRIVNEILDALGLAKNFVLKSSNVSNAMATTQNGIRYILYSTSFLEKFKADANTQWAAYAVLAHEIGHHLNGHNFGEKDPYVRKKMELEADQFSGSMLQMLGATIIEAQAGLKSFDLKRETTTHPSTTARKEAVSFGWKKRQEWLSNQGIAFHGKSNKLLFQNYTTLAKEWYDKALLEKSDLNKRVEYLTIAIQFDPNFTYAYNYRGLANLDLEKLSEAFNDFNQVVTIDSNYASGYHNRGMIYMLMDKYNEALADFNQSIRLESNSAPMFHNRGTLFQNLGKYPEAVQDFNQAIKLNPNFTKSYAYKGCALVELRRYKEAVEIIDKYLIEDGSLNWVRDCKTEALKALGKN